MTINGLVEVVFDFSGVFMLLVSSFLLLFIDCKEYKKKGYKKEYKISKFFGVFYIVFGVGMFIFARFILN